VLSHYAATFGRRSQDLGGWVEVVEPTFFNKSAGDSYPGVVCRFSHGDLLLETVKAGTLRLSIDDMGLDYSVDLPETRSDILELISRGDVSQSSFAFMAFDDSWSFVDGTAQRKLVSGKLIDVAPVVQPAYLNTSVSMRSLARHVHAPYEDVVRYAESDRLAEFFVRSDRSSRPMSACNRQLALLEKRWPATKPSAPPSARQRQLEVMARRWREPSAPMSRAAAVAATLAKKHPKYPPY